MCCENVAIGFKTSIVAYFVEPDDRATNLRQLILSCILRYAYLLTLGVHTSRFTVIFLCVCVWGVKIKTERWRREGEGRRGEYKVGRAFVHFTPRATRCL